MDLYTALRHETSNALFTL